MIKTLNNSKKLYFALKMYLGIGVAIEAEVCIS